MTKCWLQSTTHLFLRDGGEEKQSVERQWWRAAGRSTKEETTETKKDVQSYNRKIANDTNFSAQEHFNAHKKDMKRLYSRLMVTIHCVFVCEDKETANLDNPQKPKPIYLPTSESVT